MGTEATLALEGRGKIMLYPEPPVAKAQHYGTLGWPKKMRAEYFESMGHSADGRALQPSPRRKPEEIPVERGPQHHEYFIQSLRDGSPSRENAEEGQLCRRRGAPCQHRLPAGTADGVGPENQPRF
jgi:hypothetical protein